jgi:hypothetical protein
LTRYRSGGKPAVVPTDFPTSAFSQISWKKADVFDPRTYQSDLESADAIVHSIGLIFTNPEYKKFLNSKVTNPDFKSAMSLIGNSLSIGKNPMEQDNVDKSDIFNKFNRDSAVTLAKAYAEALKTQARKPFVYISSEDWNSSTDRNYIRSKREAECIIESSLSEPLKPVFIRPGLMFDDSDTKSIRHVARLTVSLISRAARLLGRNHVNPTISTRVVAKAVIESLEDSSIEGVVSLDALQKYNELN